MLPSLLIAAQAYNQQVGDAVWRRCVDKVDSVHTISCEEQSVDGPFTGATKYEVSRHGDRLMETRQRTGEPQVYVYLRHRGAVQAGVVTGSTADFHPSKIVPSPSVYDEIWRGEITGPLAFRETTFHGKPAYEFRQSQSLDGETGERYQDPHGNLHSTYFFDKSTLLPVGLILEDRDEHGYKAQFQITNAMVNVDYSEWKLTRKKAARIAQDWLTSGH